MVNIKLFLRVFFGVYFPFFGYPKIEDICEFSGKFWDLHDYPEYRGGDGHVAHFCVYICHCCGKKFQI